jgi:hypothetical protein
MQKVFQVGERRACLVIKFNRFTHRRQPTRDEQAFLRMKIKEIASVRIRYGYRRIHVLSWKTNIDSGPIIGGHSMNIGSQLIMVLQGGMDTQMMFR